MGQPTPRELYQEYERRLLKSDLNQRQAAGILDVVDKATFKSYAMLHAYLEDRFAGLEARLKSLEAGQKSLEAGQQRLQFGLWMNTAILCVVCLGCVALNANNTAVGSFFSAVLTALGITVGLK
jgi:hypothetical protein